MEEIVKVSPEKSRNLTNWNLAMFLLHLGQGIVMLFVSSNFSLPIIGNFLKFNFASQSLEPQAQTIIDLKIGPAVALFLFMSSLAHLLVATVFRGWYLKNLGRHINMARWVEYSFSSSLMILIIAMLVGVYDIAALIAIIGVNASMILFGWMMELHNQTTTRVNWTSFVFGCIAGIIPWIAIAIYLFSAGEAGNRAPDFVYWIYFSIFIFFNCFAINQILQYRKAGRWSDYLYGEKVYLVLSLVAKSLLAWQVFAGTLRP